MARSTPAAQRFAATGLQPTYDPVSADGIAFRNTGKNVLHIKNGSGASINVTVKIGKQVLGQSVTSPPQAIAANSDKFFGPFDDDYEQPGGRDLIHVDLSAVTSVTAALLTT